MWCLSVAVLLLVNSCASNHPQAQSDILFPENPEDELIYAPLDKRQHHLNRPQNEQQYIPEFNELLPNIEEGTDSKIPINFVKQFNDYDNVNDLLLHFVDADGSVSFENRFGTDEERGSYTIAKPATCKPELQPVKIANTSDPSLMYIPACTRIERCGGCCSHPLLTCRPIATEPVSMQILKTQYVGRDKLKMLGKEIVVVERHTKCQCDCKIQAQDCTESQTYSKNECKCNCKNTDEQKKCLKSDNKLWNPNTCQCQCREDLECSTGSTFDRVSCKCVMKLRREVGRLRSKKGYKSRALPVIPLDESNLD